MVFRYKSTKSVKLQIFWCTSSSGPSEANSTTIEFPAAEEWTTFEQDYPAGMATVGWGNSGDYMRCDFGTNADVTEKYQRIYDLNHFSINDREGVYRSFKNL